MVFCKSEWNGSVDNKVFEYINNIVGQFSVLYKIKKYLSFYEVFTVDQTVVHM